jgi:cell division protein FtsZ
MAARPAAAQSQAPAPAPVPSRVPGAAPVARPQPAVEVRSADRHESPIAELAQRLKADNARIGERGEHQALRPAMAPPQAAASAQAAAAPAQGASLRAAIDQAATAAVAAALTPGRSEEITIRPMPPKPSLFAEPAEREPLPPVAEPAMPRVFIPPQPERPASRAPRMPSFEELPVPGQNEYRARRGELADADHPEGRRLTLLQRLAAVGLGRREEDQKPDGRSAEPAKAPRKGSAGY